MKAKRNRRISKASKDLCWCCHSGFIQRVVSCIAKMKDINENLCIMKFKEPKKFSAKHLKWLRRQKAVVTESEVRRRGGHILN